MLTSRSEHRLTLREGNALMMGIRAVMAAIRAFQGRHRRRSEDDEALFI